MPTTSLFVNTKLHAPAAHDTTLARPRLNEALEQGLQGALTLLCAPAGFGKTTLLAEWLRSGGAGPARRVAWLSLDADDNDPARFVACLAAALDRVRPGVGQTARFLAGVPRPLAAGPRAALAALINALEPSDAAAAEAEAAFSVLVLDDYHLISTPAIHDAVAYLLDHLPRALRVVVATRANPPLPLARLRARGELSEIRAGELRFTPEEADAYLNGRLGLGLEADEVRALDERTEGWAAGLHLAAAALKSRAAGAPARGAFVAALAQSQAYMVDYLAEDVIARQPEHVRAFLAQTCRLRRLCASLCDAVVGEAAAGSQAMLEYLERHNLFVVPLDSERRWYRFHPLFAEALVSVARQAPEAATETHRRAARWFAAHGVLTEAMWHALAGGDLAAAADLVEAHYPELVQRGELTTLDSWLRALPPEMVNSRARLCLALAWAHAYSAGREEFERQVAAAEAALAGKPAAEAGPVRGELRVLQAIYASIYWEAEPALKQAQEALGLLRADDYRLRAIAYQALGNAHRMRGEARFAEAAYQEVLELSARMGAVLYGLIALTRLGQVRMLQGRLREAAGDFGEVEQQATAAAGALPLFTAEALVHLGEVQLEWDDLEAATASLGRAEALAGQTHNASAAFTAGLLRARLEASRGRVEASCAALRRAAGIAAQHGFAPAAAAQVEALEAELAITDGDLATAGEWAARPRSHGAGGPADGDADLLLARVRLAQGRPAEAHRHLAAARRAAEQQGRDGLALACLVTSALALQAEREMPKAVAALCQALARAEPEGYVRLFVEAGPGMADLLRRVHGPQQAYAEQLLRRLAPQGAAGTGAHGDGGRLVERLSAREAEVLGLMAGGASNRAIAEALVISVGTVKTHISRIMGKLDARNRTEAVARARQIGLLE